MSLSGTRGDQNQEFGRIFLILKKCFLLGTLTAFVFAVGAKAPAQDSSEAEALLQRAQSAAAREPNEEAVQLLTQALAKQPSYAIAYYLRGRENFRLGHVRESLADFDTYVKLSPQAESRQWERGISCFYTGEFERGAKQFELYQTYHNQDVENSVWRYLCVAKTDGVEKAKSNMLPIDDDRRVPMMEIYDLFRGKATPEAVLRAVEAGQPNAASLNTREFYAHLYLGLWYDAQKDAVQAKEHLLEAEKHKINHYMWDVSHVHAERLRKAE